MQRRDEYEADYYGGAPLWQEEYPERMRWDMRPGRPMPSRGTCCQGRMNELLEEMERSLKMQSEEVRRIVAEIRKICASIDGRGCMAIEGEADREMMDMLMEQVMDRLNMLSENGMPGERGYDERDMTAVETQTNDRRNWYRDLVETLIWQELLRRKMRRRMPGWRGRY